MLFFNAQMQRTQNKKRTVLEKKKIEDLNFLVSKLDSNQDSVFTGVRTD